MELGNILAVFNNDASFGNLSPDLAVEYAQQVEAFFNAPLDESKLDQYLGLAFPDYDGLCFFLEKKLGVRTYNKSKETVLQLIRTISLKANTEDKWKRCLKPFCVRLKRLCDLYWKNESEPAKHQQLALDCLIALMEKYGKQFDESELALSSTYWELLMKSEKSAFQPSVRGKMFHLLGVIADVTKNSLLQNPKTFMQLYNHTVFNVCAQVNSKDAHLEVAILLGCLKAMDKIISSSGFRIDTDGEKWGQFYICLEKIVDPKCSIAHEGPKNTKIKRREFQRAGLEIIANNGHYFGKYLFQNYEQWFSDLISWTKSNNSDDNMIGRKAMYAFLASICSYAVSPEATEMDTDSHQKLADYFLETFKTTLSSQNANRSELIVALKGMGILSVLCGDQKQVHLIFEKVMDHVKNIVLELINPVTDKYSGSLTILSTYIECVGKLLTRIDVGDANFSMRDATFFDHLHYIEQLVVNLIKFYPDLSERVRQYSHISVCILIDGLRVKFPESCVAVLDRIINLGLTHVISSPTQAELNILIESSKNANESGKYAWGQLGLRGVKSYMELWIRLTKSEGTNIKTLQLIFNRIMACILSIILKLDLTIDLEKDDEKISVNEDAGDILAAAKARSVKDFQMFVNLVEFFQIFMKRNNFQLFEGWVEVFVTKSIELIKQNKMVSGFYKILACSLDACRKLEYFKSDDADRRSIFAACNEFISNLTNRVTDCREDLLLAVLELWLSAPDEIIVRNFHSLMATLKLAFTLGRTSLTLADRCIDAVNRWIVMDDFTQDAIEKVVKELFPIWQTYFVSRAQENYLGLDQRLRNTPKHEKQMKYVLEKVDEVITLDKIQYRLLYLIGSFAHVLDLESISSHENSLAMEGRFLKYSFPFQDIKPDVFLDILIPRVLELCEISSDRQLRASACETFHTLVLYFLGYSVRTTDANKPVELFHKIFRMVMKLGCDSDILIRQLFNTLSIQSVHWFTKSNNPYADKMLDIIIDGLVQPEDAQLRDFSSACLMEFFCWALKHRNKQTAKYVLGTIQAMSTHSSPQYRLGSVVGFNGIYREFREDTDLWNAYTITLLVSFITNLSLSSDFEDDSLMIATIYSAISHLERILTKKKDYFNTPVRGRKKPTEFTCKEPVLNDLCEWLLAQVGRVDFICRKECLRLLKILAPLIRDCNSLPAFLMKYQSVVGGSMFLKLAEPLEKHDNESPQDVVRYMDAASEFFVLLSDNQIQISEFLKQREGLVPRFISSYEGLMIKPIEWFDSRDLAHLLRILSRFNYFSSFIKDPLSDSYLELSLSASKRSKHFNLTLQLCEVWSHLKISDSNSRLVKKEMTPDFEKLIMEKSSSDVLWEFQWLTILAESNFLLSVFQGDEVKSVVDKLWTAIHHTLYATSVTGQLEVQISSGHAAVLEWMLRLNIALGLDEEKLIHAIFDPTNIISKGQTSTKGDEFLRVMLKSIFHCKKALLFSELSSSIKFERIGNLIEKLLTCLRQEQSLKRAFGTEIFENTMKIWTLLSVNCDVHTVFRILSGLSSVDRQRCEQSRPLVNWWCGFEMMSSQHLSIEDKSEFFGCLKLFINSNDAQIQTDAMAAVEKMILIHIRSSLNWETVEIYVKKIIVQMLNIYESSPTIWKILELIVLFMAKYSVCYDIDTSRIRVCKTIGSRLRKIVKSFGSERFQEQSKLASTVYESIWKYSDCLENLVVCDYFLIPVVMTLSSQAAKIFFRESISSMIDKATDKKGSRDMSPSYWNSKTVAFRLMEVLPHKTDTDFVKNDLNSCYKDPKGNVSNVYKEIVSACIEFKRSYSTNTELPEKTYLAVLRSNRASYNAVTGNLILGDAKENIMEKLLTYEDLKTHFLWSNIIDSKVEINFPVVFERDEETEIETPNENTDQSASRRLHCDLNNRNNLAASSLAVDATDFDFTTEATVANMDYYHELFGSKQQDSNSNKEKKLDYRVRVDSNIGSTSEVQVSDHECIDAFVAALKKLIKFHHSSVSNPEKDPRPKQCPEWVKYLQNVLKGSHHKNVKIFVIMALMQIQNKVEFYAEHFIGPLVSLILKSEDNNFGPDKLNYFVKDIIVMLLSWSKTATPSSEMKNQLLTYVIDNVEYRDGPSMRQDLLNHHLSLIHAVLEYWQFDWDSFSPFENILNLLKSNAKVGLSVFKQFHLADKLPTSDFPKLMKQYCLSLNNSSKPVYCEGAENSGLLLRYLRKTSYESLKEVQEYVKFKVNAQKSRSSAYLLILEHLFKHSPTDLLLFKQDVFEFLKPSNFVAQAVSLIPNILKQDIENSQDKKQTATSFFQDLDGRKLFHRPCSSSAEVKAGLTLIEIFLDHYEESSNLMRALGWVKIVEQISEENDLLVRYVRCVLKVYKLICGQTVVEERKLEQQGLEKAIFRIFIRLFSDESEEVQKVITEFCILSLQKWNKSPIMLVELMTLSAAEPNALKIIVGVMLKRCAESAEYNKDIFDQPLEESIFHAFTLDTSWRMRHASYQPLFAESLSSQNLFTLPKPIQSSILSQRHRIGHFGVNLLRATLSISNQQFSPTQPNPEEGNNSLHIPQPFTLGVPSFSGAELDDIPSSNNSLSPTDKDPLFGLRKRFYQRQESDAFAIRGQQRQTMRLDEVAEKVNTKRSSVKLTRSYRIGEIPDILIKHRDLIKTISKLVELDQELARSFCVWLFTGMLEESRKNYSKEDIRLQRHCIEDAFINLTKNYGRTMNPNFAATVLEICVQNNIQLEAQYIDDLGIFFNLHELGILGLESYLQSIDDRPASSKRARRELANEIPEVTTWLRIAELYKDVDDCDPLRNIFSIASSFNSSTEAPYKEMTNALSFEMEGKIDCAVDIYNEIQSRFQDNHHQYDLGFEKFVEDSYRKCLVTLCSWDLLYDETEKFDKTKMSGTSVNDPEYYTKILPLKMKSGLQLLLMQTSQKRLENFVSFLFESNDELTKLLKNEYPVEVAVGILLTPPTADLDVDRIAKSSSMIDHGWENGISSLQILPKLSACQIRKQMLTLQQAAVLQDLLNWYKGIDSTNFLSKTNYILQKSYRACNFEVGDLSNTEVVVNERSHFFSIIIEQSIIKLPDRTVNDFNEEIFHQHMWILALGLRDKNLTVSNKYLERIKELGESLPPEKKMDWRKMYTRYLTAFRSVIPLQDWLQMWCSAWKKIKTLQCSKTDAYNIRGELLQTFIEACLGQESTVENKLKDKIKKVLSLQQVQTDSSTLTIIDCGKEASIRLANELEAENLSKSSCESKCFLQMFNLTKSLFEKFPEKYQKDENLAKVMLKCLLKSIHENYKENSTSLLFPRVFSLLESFSCLIETFHDHIQSVPAWTFLPWLDQIVTSFRTVDSLRGVFAPVIARLIKEFPHAFDIQYLDLVFKSDKNNFTASLQEMYANALKALVVPTQLFSNYLVRIKKDVGRRRLAELQVSLDELKKELAEVKLNKDFYGIRHQEYANEMTDVIDAQLTTLKELSTSSKTGTTSEETTKQSFIAVLQKIERCHQINRSKLKLKGVTVINMKDLSPWLAKFHHSNVVDAIEVPGQYDGFTKPDLALHHRVVSFSPTVSIYPSVTLPTKYYMMGNNGKKVDFLSKFGDDLRQDRRIQQLLRMSNQLFNDDNRCRTRKLGLVTYSVIPMNEEFGIMQWIPKTVALDSCIFSTEAMKAKRLTARSEHMAWIAQTSALSSNKYNPQEQYLASAKKVKRDQAEKHFDKLSMHFPNNSLRTFIQERSPSLERFFKTRQDFIVSYAALCLTHWVLGIGDRHLQNSLLSFEKGKLVGIDFGRAFGSGNTIQAIPEVVPFRLTSQLQYLMAPYGCNGIFRESMLIAWKCLLNSSDLINSILHMFVNERSIDWMRPLENSDSDASPAPKKEWQPMRAIEKKLKCANPVSIILEELNANRETSIITPYSEILRDGRSEMFQKDTLTPEEVIEVLIDLAVDKSILCRIWHGWEAWV